MSVIQKSLWEQSMYDTKYAERYRNDPVFHRMVQTLIANQQSGIMDIQSVKDAAACAEYIMNEETTLLHRRYSALHCDGIGDAQFQHPRGEGTAG